MPTVVFRYFLLFSLGVMNNISYAASAHEQDQLSLVMQQLGVIDCLVTQAAATSAAAHEERYRFDYLRLTQDIQRIRQGVQSYLFPSRAQPHDPSELVGNYRLDTPIAEPSP